MRPWRDIIGVEDWNQVVAKADTTAHVSRIKALQAKFDSTVDTPTRALRRLGTLIAAYHQVPKTDHANLRKRIGHLAGIVDAADEYLYKFEVDLDHARQRVRVVQSQVKGRTVYSEQPVERHADTGSYMTGKDAEQSIDRAVLTLKNRGFRKAEYLAQLERYYADTSRDPQALINQLMAPQARGTSWVSLTQGVRLERIDPWHRPVEVEFKNGKLVESDEVSCEETMSRAFAQWFGQVGQHGLPFFLWLEGHPVCTLGDREQVSSVRSVTYLSGPDAGAAARHRICLVYQRGGTGLWMQELKPKGLSRCATTAGYTCSNGKGVSDAAAYIWTGRDIVIAQHQENSFHHSSFNGGGAVRCAGMIKIDRGRVTYVSNNSGHYQPDKQLLRNFVHHLQQRGVLAAQCEVQCQGTKPTYKGSPEDFLAKWQSLT